MNWYKRAQVEDFMVDLKKRPVAIKPPSIKNKVNNKLHELGNYHDSIPLDEIFEILKEQNLFPIQEDGTPWAGMLIGGAVCGSEEARSQVANIPVAIKTEDGEYKLTTSTIHINWCKLEHARKKYEVVMYLGG